MPTLKSNSKHIGITLGDPCGIGPEVVAKALAHPAIANLAQFQLIGNEEIYRQYAKHLAPNCSFVQAGSLVLSQWKRGEINPLSGKDSLDYLKKAVELLKHKEIDALVTAPVSKEAIAHTDPSFVGHTEFLADNWNIKHVGMMFVSETLRTVLVTRHIPLRKVSQTLNSRLIFETIALTQQALGQFFKIKDPVIGVCGLNPHAGEGGLLGKEEMTKIIPAIKKALKNKWNIEGPLSADSLFAPDNVKRYDAIVAMYHDQGLIPVKALFFSKLVNLTVGLPFVRTSPAHGTAFDIAGKNMADPSSMCEAIKLAAGLSDS